MSGMGWRAPEDRSHERKYALAAAMPETPCPVVIGIPWYASFDIPEYANGAYWIARGTSWGSLRGGHAVCLRPPAIKDVSSAYLHYNQGQEGACVGFATSRAATLFNRRLYSGFALYHAAQQRDPWPGDDYEGTSVNAGLDTLRLEGAWPVRAGAVRPARLEAGIGSFLWARSVDEVTQALKSTEPFVRILNSWGVNYPKEVRLPLEGVARLMAEDGEFGVPVDRPGA